VYVKAKDAAGNESGRSRFTTFTTTVTQQTPPTPPAPTVSNDGDLTLSLEIVPLVVEV